MIKDQLVTGLQENPPQSRRVFLFPWAYYWNFVTFRVILTCN